MSNQAKPVHELDPHVAHLSGGRWSGYVEHRINGGHKSECDTNLAGYFDSEAEAFRATFNLAKTIEQFP